MFCCHVQVSAKHWVYPRTGLSIPLEFAYAPLIVSEIKSGCDLRPADPRTTPAAPPYPVAEAESYFSKYTIVVSSFAGSSDGSP